jgi:hypothetical protein
MAPERTTEAELAPYLQQLDRLPFVKKVAVRPGRDGADAVLRVTTPGGRVDLEIQLKRSHLTSGAAAHAEARADQLLLAPYIGAPAGEELEGRGIQFLDRSGNCFLQLPTGQVARVQGRTATPKPGRTKARRAPAYKVLFALLAEPELLEQSLRAIASAAGTSRQAVVDAIDRLASEGYLISHGRERRWTDRERAPLLERWVEGYQQTVRPRLFFGRFRLREKGPPAVERQLAERLGDQMRYGGTAGAYRLVGHYRGPLTTIHLPPTDAMRRTLRVLRADDGELIWLAPLGEVGNRSPDPSTVHPLLIYAELRSDPDPRAQELAAMLQAEHLPWAS